MNILILNCGSSSQSFKVYRVLEEGPPKVIAFGKAKSVATKTQAVPRIEWTIAGEEGVLEVELPTHRRAAEQTLRLLGEHRSTLMQSVTALSMEGTCFKKRLG